MSNYIVKKTVSIKDIEVEWVMEAALQGVTYWADEAYIMGELRRADKNIYISQALTRGYKIRIHDAEGEKWHILTMKKFLKGLKLVDNANFDCWDMFDADRLVQNALFGKEIYA